MPFPYLSSSLVAQSHPGKVSSNLFLHLCLPFTCWLLNPTSCIRYFQFKLCLDLHGQTGCFFCGKNFDHQDFVHRKHNKILLDDRWKKYENTKFVREKVPNTPFLKLHVNKDRLPLSLLTYHRPLQQGYLAFTTIERTSFGLSEGSIAAAAIDTPFTFFGSGPIQKCEKFMPVANMPNAPPSAKKAIFTPWCYTNWRQFSLIVPEVSSFLGAVPWRTSHNFLSVATRLLCQ